MSVLIDARPHSKAIVAAVTAELDIWSAYTYDKVPGLQANTGTAPGIFVAVSVERRTNPVLRTPGRAGSAGWRVSLRCVGRTVAEAQWAQWRVGVALNENRLLVNSVYTSRFQPEPSDAPAPDDGRYSAVETYIYTHQ